MSDQQLEEPQPSDESRDHSERGDADSADLPSTVDDRATPAGTPSAATAATPATDDPVWRRFANRVRATTAQLVVSGTCLALLLAAIGYRVVADDGQDEIPEPTNTAAADFQRLMEQQKYRLPQQSPADNHHIRIVEQGFSPIKDVGNDNLVSYGVILENTHPKKAAVVTLSLRILGKQGESLVDQDSSYALTKKVPLILPRQRIGAANTVYVTSPNVASVTFTVTEVEWLPVDPERRYSAPLTAKVLATGIRKGRGQTLYWGKGGVRAVPKGDSLVVRFEVTSSYRWLLGDPSAELIFRNANGAIIGGSKDIFGVYDQFPPGVSEHQMRVKYGPPAGIDLSKIEVYPYPWRL